MVILVLGGIIGSVLRFSFSFLFFVQGRPLLWSLATFVAAVIVWGISAGLGWGVSLPAWICTVAGLLNTKPELFGRRPEDKKLFDEIYDEAGIKHGRLKHTLGLAVFIVASLASWALFYGQICNQALECKPLLTELFS